MSFLVAATPEGANKLIYVATNDGTEMEKNSETSQLNIVTQKHVFIIPFAALLAAIDGLPLPVFLLCHQLQSNQPQAQP